MPPLVRRQGRVIGIDGAPVPGARIVIVAGSRPMPEIALLADRDGRFELALPEGRFRLRALGSGSAAGEVEVNGAPATDEIWIIIGK